MVGGRFRWIQEASLLRNTRRVMRRALGLVSKLVTAVEYDDGLPCDADEIRKWKIKLGEFLESELERLGRKAGGE